ncbi:LamB/YcsF family protein [Marinimicrococcus flavescens]|uniref:5-oxoprolinase subunit A n=1 Tax=Marinimicrococcus flavescens TaxID=3031815 RepID=A0AAP3XQ68_9PROT|nr:5-oxoprolinase subunit PxpA [Marinimicrococcus flavescens]
MGLAVDLNSDLGESFGAWTMGNDAEMLDIVTTANVACGFHAGDPLVMHETVRLALERGVEIGAHPGFLDLWGFGRRPIQGERPGDVEKLIVYQIGALQAMAAVVGHKVRHLKTHGALGNMAAVDADLAMAVARASKAVDPEMIFVVMPGNELEKAGEKLGLRMAREVYADRTYDDAGNLTSRKLPGAVIHDSAEATQRVLRMLEDGAITSVSGKRIPVAIDTICVHGDNPAAVAMARGIREAMEKAGVTLRPFARAL